ncbi:MAG: type II toxin-antitoxin system RelE/ParE family toxin [Sideroxydans sp.]
MSRVIWAPQALADVHRVYRFLESKNPLAAKEAVKAIRQSVTILVQHPEVGRPIEDMEPEYREWPIAFGSAGYLILYRFDGQIAIILALRHQREVGY